MSAADRRIDAVGVTTTITNARLIPLLSR